MRRATALWIGVIGVVLLALALHATPLCEYKPPVTDLSDLLMSFSYQYVNDPYGSKERDINAGRFVVDYKRLYDTSDYGFDIELANELDISLSAESTYKTFADGSYKRYLTPDGDGFAYAGAVARSSSSFSALGISANIGLGLGRFSDVTPMAVATRIDEDLYRRSRITQRLRTADLLILAYELDNQETYRTQTALLEGVQDVIEGSGFVAGGELSAVDLVRINDLLRDAGFSRYCGMEGRIGVGYEIMDPSGGDNDLLVTAAFNYAHTTTPRSQLLVRGSLSGPPELSVTNRIDVGVQYDHFVAEFCRLRAAYAFARETWASEATDIHRVELDVLLKPLRSAEVTLQLSLEHRPYYLEWSADLRLGISIQLL